MVAAAVVDQELAALTPLLEAGNIVIDGGNSFIVTTFVRGAKLNQRSIHCSYWNQRRTGIRAWVLSDDRRRKRHRKSSNPIFASLAPGADATPHTPGRAENKGTAQQGFLHCRPQGAGHFVKMVHNGIKYGIMAAYAEGLNILYNAGVGKQANAADAETTPVRNPEYYQYELDLPQNSGSLAQRQCDRLMVVGPHRHRSAG